MASAQKDRFIYLNVICETFAQFGNRLSLCLFQIRKRNTFSYVFILFYIECAKYTLYTFIHNYSSYEYVRYNPETFQIAFHLVLHTVTDHEVSMVVIRHASIRYAIRKRNRIRSTITPQPHPPL